MAQMQCAKTKHTHNSQKKRNGKKNDVNTQRTDAHERIN